MLFPLDKLVKVADALAVRGHAGIGVRRTHRLTPLAVLDTLHDNAGAGAKEQQEKKDAKRVTH
jgi:hypothetical protein